MDLSDALARIDELYALPFPEREGWYGPRWSGPDHHVAVLRESRDFWEDRSEEVVAAAERDIADALARVTAALTARWGAPVPVELSPYFGVDPYDPGYVAPEPAGFLAQNAPAMQVWRPDGPDARWLALAVGQADPEFPVQLFLAVGEGG
ncbi:hypothetical protein, partial [Kitasatospora putterlickiae]